MTRANDRPWIFPLALAWSLWAGGCGSGSSGFDEASAEKGAIETAVGAGVCEPADGLLICDAGAPAPADGILASPGATLTIEPASGERLPCLATGTGDECRFEILIAPSGFPDGTSFLGAYGVDEAGEPWRGNDLPFLPSGRGSLDARFTLGGETGLPSTAGTRIRVAVLVYLPGTFAAPRPPGESEDLLSSFGADLAYLATDLTVDPTAP